jgi:hypothetical protein
VSFLSAAAFVQPETFALISPAQDKVQGATHVAPFFSRRRSPQMPRDAQLMVAQKWIAPPANQTKIITAKRNLLYVGIIGARF